MSLKYHRIVLQLNGKNFSESNRDGLDLSNLSKIAQEIKSIHEMGVQIAIVVGGENIWQDSKRTDFEVNRTTSDYMWMLATVINSLALADALEGKEVPGSVMSAVEIKNLVEPYIRKHALEQLEQGNVVIFCGGTGNPYYSLDTATALRAAEIDAELIVKASKNVGVFDKDPEHFSDAKIFEQLTWDEVSERRLEVMDIAALSIIMENNIPVVLIDLLKSQAIATTVQGEKVGTLIMRASTLMDKLAGDSSTDAPLPKKKRKGK